MKFKLFSRRKNAAEAVWELPEESLDDRELLQAFEELHVSSLRRKRRSIAEVFAHAAQYSPLPGSEQDALVNSFEEAVASLSTPLLFHDGFEAGSREIDFYRDVSKNLQDVALTSRIPALRNSAVAALPTVFLRCSRHGNSDLDFLISLTQQDDATRRVAAVGALVTIAKSPGWNYKPGETDLPWKFGVFGQSDRFDIRSAEGFSRAEPESLVTCHELIMGVIAHVLKTDPDMSVRQAAGQALRDVAAANRPKHQFLAASYAAASLPQQADPGVRSVIESIFEDSKTVNFRPDQKIPGLAWL